MGDRGNIIIREGRKNGGGKHLDVYLYSHWGGSELALVARDALKRGRDRWTDAPYLARIVFCEMLMGNADERTLANMLETIGFGISPVMGDNEHLLVVLDVAGQTVLFVKEKGGTIWQKSFAAYCELSNDEIEEAFSEKGGN